MDAVAGIEVADDIQPDGISRVLIAASRSTMTRKIQRVLCGGLRAAKRSGGHFLPMTLLGQHFAGLLVTCSGSPTLFLGEGILRVSGAKPLLPRRRFEVTS
jgi:hypothetical protein